jgi:hypothetical protein
MRWRIGSAGRLCGKRQQRELLRLLVVPDCTAGLIVATGLIAAATRSAAAARSVVATTRSAATTSTTSRIAARVAAGAAIAAAARVAPHRGRQPCRAVAKQLSE